MAPRQLGCGHIKDPFGGGEEGFALRAAGAIGDMVRRESVVELVQLGEALGFVMRSADKGQGGAAKLVQTGLEKGSRFGLVSDFAVAPGRFQSGGVSKSARRKGRVCELPQEPVGGWRGRAERTSLNVRVIAPTTAR